MDNKQVILKHIITTNVVFTRPNLKKNFGIRDYETKSITVHDDRQNLVLLILILHELA